jgi:hypothetical protein
MSSESTDPGTLRSSKNALVESEDSEEDMDGEGEGESVNSKPEPSPHVVDSERLLSTSQPPLLGVSSPSGCGSSSARVELSEFSPQLRVSEWEIEEVLV